MSDKDPTSIKDGPIGTFSQCGEYYDKDKFKDKLLYTGPKERNEDE